MIDILFPSSGKSSFFNNYYYPKLILEINGKTIVQYVIENYKNLKNSNIIFALNEDECIKFHIDEAIKSLIDENASIVKIQGEPKGALCTCLLSIDKISEDNELIIANSDQIIDININDVVEYFRDNNADCGLICFESIHPRWSYVKIKDNIVIESAEKRPISKNAIAGFYYFKKSSDFIECAKRVIMKKSLVHDKYYISSTINEMILLNKNIVVKSIGKELYNSFYSPEKVIEYEKRVGI